MENKNENNVFDFKKINKMSLDMENAVSFLTASIDRIKNQIDAIADNIKELFAKNKYLIDLLDYYEKIEKDPNSFINWENYLNKLKEYFWMIPYEMGPSELLKILKEVNSEDDFDNYILNYFDDNKIKSLIDNIEKKLSDNKTIFFKQIKVAYNNKLYMLVGLGLITIIDDELSFFIKNKKCTSRYNMFEPIIKKMKNEPADTFPFFIMIINNNINTLFENYDFDQSITIETNKKIRRHLALHGKYYYCDKIATIMLINTLYNILLLKEIKPEFNNILKKENGIFVLITNNVN